MPRKLSTQMTIETLEDEIMFTAAALNADPDAQDLLPQTSTWLEQIETYRLAARALRQTVANTDASRVVADERLDKEVLRFSRELLHDVESDRQDPRYKTFFSKSPSRFIRMALSEEATAVEQWLTHGSDPVLDTHRQSLLTQVETVRKALSDTSGLYYGRAALRTQKEALVQQLTDARDALRSSLVIRAQERGLGRTWPDAFFRVEQASTSTTDLSSDSSNSQSAADLPA